MKIGFLPKSRLVRWSVCLTIYFLFMFIFLYVFAELLNVITIDIIITIFVITIIIAALISFCTGIVAFLRNHERSALLYISIIISFIAIAFFVFMMIGG